MDQRKTAPFREQHDRILVIVNKISSCLISRSELLDNAGSVKKYLIELSRELKMHLTLEDTALYPILYQSGIDEIKKTTKEYIDEMGTIKEVFLEYISHWPSSFSIKENPEKFIKETELLFTTLGNRIELENSGLYTMIDNMFL